MAAKSDQNLFHWKMKKIAQVPGSHVINSFPLLKSFHCFQFDQSHNWIRRRRVFGDIDGDQAIHRLYHRGCDPAPLSPWHPVHDLSSRQRLLKLKASRMLQLLQGYRWKLPHISDKDMHGENVKLIVMTLILPPPSV